MYISYANILGMWDSHIRKLMFIMRLTIVLILTTMMHINASTFAQKITYVRKDATLHLVFKQIKKQAGYNVVLNDDKFDAGRTLNANFKNAELSAVMAKVLEGLPFTYTILKKTIVIREKPNIPVPNLNRAANIDVRGVVHDDQGVPLVGATVTIRGTSRSTKTDEKGEFKLDNVADKAVLIISFLGFESREINAAPDTGIIEMALSEDKLLEVEINAGYYTVKDRKKTGSISRVTGETISKQPISNPLEGLIGRMSGVNIQQTSGVAGGGFRVEIRGVNSLRTDAREPLVLIDGVPYPSQQLASTGITVTSVINASPLNYLNPANIESIEVLKDADATAIYGSRGANGVILIKTKVAKLGRTAVDINAYSGISQVGSKLKLLNTEQYLEMRNEAFENDGVSPGPLDYDVNDTWSKSSYTDWQDVLIGKIAYNSNIQTAITGGNEHTQIAFRGGYSNQNTVFPGEFGDEKASGALSVSHSSSNQRFKVNFSANYLLDNNNLPREDLTSQITLAPNAPDLYDENGNLNWELNESGASTWVNPMSILRNLYNGKSNTALSNGQIGYEILPGLIVKSTMGYTNVKLRESVINLLSSLSPSVPQLGQNTLALTSLDTWIMEPQVTYNKKLGRNNMQILVGSTFQSTNQTVERIFGTSYTSDLVIRSISAAPNKTATGSASQYRYNAIFSRINYDYEGKYLVNLTGRRDGSSRFGPGKQFANFGAAGIAWIFTEENFIRDNFSWLSFGKLRGSFGVTGSDQIPNYGYLDTYSASQPYDGGGGLIPTRLANEDYSWESTQKLELALELGLLKDRVLFTANWYRNRTTNQLVGYSLPDIAGFPSVQYNLPAKMQNTGLEFEVNTANLSSKTFNWRSSFNLTVPKNTLLEYPKIEGSSYAGIYTVGKSIYTPIGLNYLGVDPQTGLFTFEDINGNGNDLELADQKTAHKEVTVHLFGGLSNTFRYKSISLDIFFQFASKTTRDPISQFNAPGGRGGNQLITILDRWQQIGDDVSIQKFSQANVANGAFRRFPYISNSNRFVDASFIRLKNASFSWQAPVKWTDYLKIQYARIYIQGQNLFTLSKYMGDPEVVNIKALPLLTQICIGVQAGL